MPPGPRHERGIRPAFSEIEGDEPVDGLQPENRQAIRAARNAPTWSMAMRSCCAVSR